MNKATLEDVCAYEAGVRDGRQAVIEEIRKEIKVCVMGDDTLFTILLNQILDKIAKGGE